MIEAEQSYTEEPHQLPERPEPFRALAEGLLSEQSRLSELAQMCRSQAELLSEREAEFVNRERWIDEARETLNHQLAELSRREAELSERTALVEQAERRLAEASERATELATLGAQLVERFGVDGSPLSVSHTEG